MRVLARLLTHPAVCIICGVLVLWDWSRLPDGQFSRSTCAQLFPRGDRPATGCLRNIPIALFRTPAGLRAFLLTADRAQDPPEWESVVEFALARRPVLSSGFWAPTSATHEIVIFGDGSLNAAELAQLRPALMAAFDSAPDGPAVDPMVYSLLKAGIMSRTEALPAGYIHNTIAVTLALFFAAGLPRTIAAVPLAIARIPREGREDRRFALGLCPACGYDLRGEFEVGCPECGWNRPGSGRAARNSPGAGPVQGSNPPGE